MVGAGLLVLWALLFLPNLRTNPNWYGDEGEWMEKSWTFIHGTPRAGPVVIDFVFPYPDPPLYMLINGALLRMFGEDLVVRRALGAVTGLGAAALLFWIGTRLRDKTFGFLCAAAFLVYSEANVNFRWVRSHPMSGTWALASVGFLGRYVQEKRLRGGGGVCGRGGPGEAPARRGVGWNILLIGDGDELFHVPIGRGGGRHGGSGE